MARTQIRPDSNGKLKRKKGPGNENALGMRVPVTLKKAIIQAAAHESTVRGHSVSVNEWLTRAAIDRLGEVFGTSVARQFYQQFFNGTVAIHTDISVPIVEGCHHYHKSKCPQE